MIESYYSDDHVTLYCGDMREILPELGEFDACVTDPPYQETSLKWDRWVDGWPALVAEHTRSMWCFGSMRMFMERRDEFGPQYLRDERGRFRKAGEFDWKLSQDVVWEKHNGSGPGNSRFRRVHEMVTHWYRGPWDSIHREVPRIPAVDPSDRGARRGSAASARHRHTAGDRAAVRDGLRLQRSVIFAHSLNGRAIHPTEKPAGIVAPLIEYAVPIGGTVLDAFAGSCSTGLTARQLGRRAVLIEGDEAMCEKAVVERLSVPDLFSGGAA